MNTPGADDHPPAGSDPVARGRTYSWPAPGGDGRNAVYSGLAALRRVLDGELHLSPGAHTLGLRLTEVEEGSVTLTATGGEWACNSGGTIHGGIVSGWVDSALGYATASAVEPGVGYNTLDLTVRYLHALLPDRTPATIRAEVEHCGRSTAVVQVRVHDTTGRVCASASGAMMLFRP